MVLYRGLETRYWQLRCVNKPNMYTYSKSEPKLDITKNLNVYILIPSNLDGQT